MKTKSPSNRKVQLAFASSIVILVVVGTISYRDVVLSSKSDQWVRHSHQVLTNLQNLLSAMRSVESSYRGFVLTGKESYLELYPGSLSNAAQAEAAIRNLTADNPKQQSQLSTLERLTDQKIQYAETVVGLRRTRGFEAAVDSIRAGDGQRLMDQVLGVIRTMQDEELQLLELRRADAKRRLGQTQTFLIVGTVLGLLIAAAANWSIQRDISRHLLGEEALRNSEEQYRMLIQGIQNYAILMLGPRGEIVSWNPGAERMTGRTYQEIVGRSFSGFFPPDDIKRGRPGEILRLAAASSPYEEQGMLVRKDGSCFPVHTTFTALRNQAGNLRGFSVISRDLSESTESEAKYRGLLEAAPDAMVVVDQGGEIVLLNVQAEKQFGYRRDELVGQKVKNIIPEGFAERMVADRTRSADDALAQQIGTGIELSGRRKDGSEFPIEIMLSPLQSAEGILVTAAIRDIAERKRRENDLSRLVAVVESSYDAIASLTPQGTILTWNHGAERIFGYSAEEALGQSIRFLSPPDRTAEDRKLLKTVKRSGTVEQLETVRVKKDGTHIQVAITLSPINDSDGRMVGVSSVARDITESRNVEQMLRQSQKMEAVGQLAGGVAHDFNNLLGVIIGYTGLLLDRHDLDERQRKDIEQIQDAGNRATLLTRQLLAFSRKQVLQPKVLNLNTVVAGAEKLLHRLIGEDIELLVVLAPGLGPVKADSGQLEQIIMNLAVNARDAMPAGGKLTIETSSVELDEEYAAQHAFTLSGPHVILAVTDTGCGMDEKTKAHIFEPFFTTKEFGKGTGLGLSTVYGIVKQSGGSISAHSELGIGSAFKIYLPCASPVLEIESPSDKMERVDRGSQTILIVEDDAALLQVTHRCLEENGYTVLVARSPTEAVQICGSHVGPIHLMVTDVIMPGMNGTQLASHFSALHPEMKVLYVSGYNDDVIVRHGVLEPGLVLLQKPFSPRALARKVDEVLATVLPFAKHASSDK
jgi:PAS domain S-box-containing protein